MAWQTTGERPHGDGRRIVVRRTGVVGERTVTVSAWPDGTMLWGGPKTVHVHGGIGPVTWTVTDIGGECAAVPREYASTTDLFGGEPWLVADDLWWLARMWRRAADEWSQQAAHTPPADVA